MDFGAQKPVYSDWVIGIGASAGGLEALGLFVSNIPPSFNGTVIVAQHLAPHSKSMMVELLRRQSTLPVLQAEDQMPIEHGTIYVVPPNHDLDLVDSRLVLRMADDAIRPKPSVNEFFSSLARACGRKCIGIILSGTGTDGSSGIEAIKAAGGITLAQDDQSAKYDGMPRSAIGTGKIDSIFPPEILAKNLFQIIEEHENRGRQDALDPSGLGPILEIIREKLGQDFRLYKSSTISRRIAKRMSALGVETYGAYAEILKSTPGELGEVAGELLISVTEFFRNPEVFTDLRNRLTEMAREFESEKEFRVWVAGCATGEEAYTIAVILLDIQDRLRKNFSIKIFATDLDHDAIQEARQGVYTAKDVERVPDELFERFFHPHSQGKFELSKRVRDCVVFARQDLIQNPPFVKLDLISCRNVLIYFEPELQKKVFEIFHYALAPSGLLLLGQSESVIAAPALFSVVDRKQKLYAKINVASTRIPAARFSKPPAYDMPQKSRRAPALNSLEELGYKKILKTTGIAAVIVDEQANVLQVFGDVSGILTLQNHADLVLPNLLPKGAGVEVAILLRKAMGGDVIRSRTHRVGAKKTGIAFQLVVQKLVDDDETSVGARDLFLITFDQKKIAADAAVAVSSDLAPNAVSSRLAELEEELLVTKEHLQTVIEELGVSNEELQSLNEELSSTNEELQATNEELETTNEELQSSNEELTTVNEELSAKSAEIKSITLGLVNIQDSIGSPLVVLDENLRLVRSNADATKIFQIIEGDVGRDIKRISSRCEIPDFIELANHTLQSGVPTETQCEAMGRVYQVRIMPSYDEKRKIIGIILIFIDDTVRIRTQEKLVASEERTRAIIDASSSMICLKDNLGRYLLVNSAFKSFFNITGEVVGRTDREILPEKTAVQLRDAELEVFITRNPVRREEVVEVGEKRHVLLSNRFPVMDLQGRTPIAVGTFSLDITAQVEAQDAMKKSEALYRAIAEDQAVLVCRHAPSGKLTYVNDAFAHYFEASAKKLYAKSFFEFADPLDRTEVVENLRLISNEHPIEQFENRVLKSGNDKRWIRWIHRGVFDHDGEIIEIQSVGFDVTDYRVQTDRLRQKEAVFSGIFDNTSDYISLYRLSGDNVVLESLNRSAEKLTGSFGSEFVGRNVESLLSAAGSEVQRKRFQTTVDSKKAQVFEEEIMIAGDTRHFLTTIVPIPGPSGAIDRVAALSRDISSYKKIETDLRHAKESADVANRAKSDFLATMSHELRTPLNVVLGFCQMLEFSRLDLEQKNYVSGIQRSGQLLLTLIEDILDITKIEAGKIRLESVAFSVGDFVTDISALFSSQAAEKGIELKKTIATRADRNVIGDPNRLRQILVNFIGNAMKFTSRGKVEISVDAGDNQDAGERTFTFSVKDTGIGIQDKDKPKIFQKFSQAESGHARRFGGSGLGLAISRQLANLMGGDVGFQSEHGTGSTFWLKVPLTLTNQISDVRMLKAGSNPMNETPTRKLKVLVVDDSADSRAVAGLFLERLGHTPRLVESGADALQELAESPFDIVLMDMQMPKMDGCETTRVVRSKISSDIPIIALTANALTEDVDRCIESGMNDYLSKPVRVSDLNNILNKWSKSEVRNDPDLF